MKGIFEHLNSWLHRKESEKFTTDSLGNTAVRINGEINLNVEVENGLTQNIIATNAGTEYSFVIPLGTKRFEFQARKDSTVQWSFQSGETGITYCTLRPGNVKKEDNLKLTTAITVYFRCSKDNETIELSSWS